MLHKNGLYDLNYVHNTIQQKKITIITLVPSLLKPLVPKYSPDEFKALWTDLTLSEKFSFIIFVL